ncbi:hypothetical protein AB0M42_09540 [Streptomyces sp. NPDC051784]|uniref:hypothetical protein n=1 Tax=Streptomyces sp. NPDC051784 TaxID=3155805 RepID=UPI00343E0E6A
MPGPYEETAPAVAGGGPGPPTLRAPATASPVASAAPGTSPSRDDTIEEVLTSFYDYARVRGSRDRILTTRPHSPRDEQRAFDALHRAMTRLRTR